MSRVIAEAMLVKFMPTSILPQKMPNSTAKLRQVLCGQRRQLAQLTIGDLKLQSSVILSPLERVSDVGFRRLCFEQGAGLTWTEMVYASELVKPHNDRCRGANLIDTHDAEVLTGVQLLIDRTTAKDGHGVDLLRASLERLEEGAATDRPEWKSIRAVDLNFGCPARAISRRGAGPAQLRRRSKMRAIFETLAAWKKATSLQIGAVGAKIRLGNTQREKEYKVYLPVAEAAADTLDYLVVHARHGEQRSREPPDWEAIAEVKLAAGASSALRVIGNGDVRTPGDLNRMRLSTGCDGVMVGRAAMRNPWCLRALADASDGSVSDSRASEPSTSDSFAAAARESEWPTLSELERAARENEARSNGLPAAARFRRFRIENFERIRIESARAASGDGASTRHKPPASEDWYVEWSKSAARRRQLEKLDDVHTCPTMAQETSNNHTRPSTRRGSLR